MGEPAVSPDGKYVAAVAWGDSSTWLELYTMDGEFIRQITTSYGIEIHNPTFSPDGKFIAFEIFDGEQLDIGWTSISGGPISVLKLTHSNERFPSFISNDAIFFSSNQNNIYNIFAVQITTQTVSQLTNTLKGNMTVDYDPVTHTLYYGCFTSSGFKLCRRKYPVLTFQNSVTDVRITAAKLSKSQIPFSLISNGLPYKFIPSRANVYPVLSAMDYQFVAGAQFTFSDQLFKHNFSFAGFLGTRGFQWLSFLYVNRQLPVNIFATADRLKYLLEESFSVSGLTFSNMLISDRVGVGVTANAGEHVAGSISYFYNHAKLISPLMEFSLIKAYSATPSGEIYELHSIPLNLTFRWRHPVNLKIYFRVSGHFNRSLSYMDYYYNTGDYSFVKTRLIITGTHKLYKGLKLGWTLAGGLISRNVDPLHEFFLGGFYYPLFFGFYGDVYMPGYPYLSIHGEYLYFNRILMPYTKGVRTRAILGNHLTFHGLSVYGFVDVGNAFSRKKWFTEDEYTRWNEICTDAGVGMRLKLNIFYNVPFDLFVMVAYPFNNIPVKNENGEVYKTRGKVKTYFLLGWSSL